jgi:hypothetical protein
MNAQTHAGFAMSAGELDAAMRYLRKSIAAGLTKLTRSFPRTTTYELYQHKNPAEAKKLFKWADNQAKRRAEFLKRGLTTSGKPRVRRSKYAPNL